MPQWACICITGIIIQKCQYMSFILVESTNTHFKQSQLMDRKKRKGVFVYLWTASNKKVSFGSYGLRQAQRCFPVFIEAPNKKVSFSSYGCAKRKDVFVYLLKRQIKRFLLVVMDCVKQKGVFAYI